MPLSDVIARVGSSTITVEDFRYRAGLTVRPGSIKTVNAVLNNLIAEKLLSMEAGDTCALAMSAGFKAHIEDSQTPGFERLELFKGLHIQAFGICIGTHTGHPRKSIFDGLKNFQQPLLRNNQGVSVTEKQTALSLAILGRKFDIFHNNGIRLNSKTLS